MFGARRHVNWSNLPLRPIFLPLMARLTFELAEVEQTLSQSALPASRWCSSCPTARSRWASRWFRPAAKPCD